MKHVRLVFVAVVCGALFVLTLYSAGDGGRGSREELLAGFDRVIVQNARELINQGREIFRFDTFGDEVFWGDTLRLHEAIATVSPNAALSLGLKVDVEALPTPLVKALRHGKVNLEDPAVTLALLKR